jgi:hypothetical protein
MATMMGRVTIDEIGALIIAAVESGAFTVTMNHLGNMTVRRVEDGRKVVLVLNDGITYDYITSAIEPYLGVLPAEMLVSLQQSAL